MTGHGPSYESRRYFRSAWQSFSVNDQNTLNRSARATILPQQAWWSLLIGVLPEVKLGPRVVVNFDQVHRL